MSKSGHEPPEELEDQFILRLPPEHAATVRKMIHSGSAAMKNKLKIVLAPDERHAVVQVDGVFLNAKVVDLPCVIESLKTLDKKSFYKTADISQMLVCTADGDHSPMKEPVSSPVRSVTGKNEMKEQKKYAWKHGITPPLKNVRKKRFHKTIKKADVKEAEELNFAEEEEVPYPTLLEYIESPDTDKEVRKLLSSDNQAVSFQWEIIDEDEAKEKENQGSIPRFERSSPVTSDSKQSYRSSSEFDIFRETFSNSTRNSDDYKDNGNDEDNDDDDEEYDDRYYQEEEEEENYEENLKMQLQAKLTECARNGGKELISSIIEEIQKQIPYFEQKLQMVWCKAQRQKELIMKVEHLPLKRHLHYILQQVKLQEKQKIEQIIYLKRKLRHFLKKKKKFGEPSA